jgi:hypothetical protein
MRLSYFREEFKNVLNGELKCDHCTWVAPLNKFLDSFVLLNEFFLHCPPHNL